MARRSLDARRKGHPRWVVDAEVEVEGYLPSTPSGVDAVPEAEPPPPPVRAPDLPPVILGAGPAGLFCAWGLLERGVRSIVVDRGKTVNPRRRDVARLMRSGELDSESNMNFGEGGAGAYTDGKLSTRIRHPAVRKVVELFARFGNSERILVQGKPHVGSDVLPAAVSAMRQELERGGCEFVWNARATDLEVLEGRVRGLVLADGRTLPCDRLVLAPGNSAREIYELFARRGWPIEAKPFAVGFRVEHPQALIDRIQYGRSAGTEGLPSADYRLAENPSVGGRARGVFSFCMCPGGVVVPTPTEPEMQVTNGMSNSGRSSPLANAGLVVAVSPEEFAAEGFHGPLAGLEWQRKWERAAYDLGGGGYRAPAQRLAAWLAGRPGDPPVRARTGPASPTPTSGGSIHRKFTRRSGRRYEASTGGCAASSLPTPCSSGSRAGPARPAASREARTSPPLAWLVSTPPARAPATPGASSRRRWTASRRPRPSVASSAAERPGPDYFPARP